MGADVTKRSREFLLESPRELAHPMRFAFCKLRDLRHIRGSQGVVTRDLALPVKSMAGETLGAADLTEGGVVGDRIVQVQDAAGRILSARTRPLLLRHCATLEADGQVLVDGRPWTADDVAGDVEAAAGAGTCLVQSDSEDRFDILPLLIASDGMLAAVGYDRRRFRPNLVIGGVVGLAERQWEGARLRVGPVVIGMEGLTAHDVVVSLVKRTSGQACFGPESDPKDSR